jgi:hypothetical protein
VPRVGREARVANQGTLTRANSRWLLAASSPPLPSLSSSSSSVSHRLLGRTSAWAGASGRAKPAFTWTRTQVSRREEKR